VLDCVLQCSASVFFEIFGLFLLVRVLEVCGRRLVSETQILF
jgi:hypothetical protein